MKMLVHRDPTATTGPVTTSDLKAYLRVTHSDEDAAISNMGAAAGREIEQFAQIALLTQTIRVTIFDPRREYSLNLPIGPVIEGDTPTVTIDGEPFTDFDFVSGNRPYIRWLAPFYDLMPSRMMIEYQAGFGASSEAVPPDIAQAIMDQTAMYYDGSSPMDAKSLTTSPHMARIGARYRGVQV